MPHSYLCHAEICGILGLLIKGCVNAFRTLKIDPVINYPFCMKLVSDFMQINSLMLQRPSQHFNEDIIQILAVAFH